MSATMRLGWTPSPVRDLLLALAGHGRDHAQQPDVRRREADGLEPFGHALGRVGPDLREQEGDAEVLAISSTDSPPARAAASSMASGTPSSRRHSSATAAALARVIWKSGRTACARSTKSWTLS
jgi:hypothetical protein